MLDLAILGLLSERDDLHGYEIRRQLREGLGVVTSVSFGSLYPALARLEGAGAVEAVEGGGSDAPSGTSGPVPLTGSLSGELAVMRARHHEPRHGGSRRSRKAYRITDAGKAALRDLLSGTDASEDPRNFELRLSLARHLPAPARLALLERRRAQLEARVDATARERAGRPLDEYARSVAEHHADALQRDIGWIDRLIEVEQARAARAERAGRTERTGRTERSRKAEQHAPGARAERTEQSERAARTQSGQRRREATR